MSIVYALVNVKKKTSKICARKIYFFKDSSNVWKTPAYYVEECTTKI